MHLAIGILLSEPSPDVPSYAWACRSEYLLSVCILRIRTGRVLLRYYAKTFVECKSNTTITT